MRLICLEPEADEYGALLSPLTASGHHIEAVTDRERVLEGVRARRVEAAIVPHSDDGALLMRLRQLEPELPLVVVGVADTAAAASIAIARGAMGYVPYAGGPPSEATREALSSLVARAAGRLRTSSARRRELEETLRLRKFHEDVLNSVGQAIVVIDAQGRLVFNNPEAARILGEEAVGREATTTGAAVPIVQMLVDSLTEDEPRTRMLALQESDQKVFLDVTTSVLRRVDGKLTGAVAIVSDRSIEKHLEQQLFHSERLATLGSLLASIAHEINNTLTSVTGCAEMGLELAASADRAAGKVRDPETEAALHDFAAEIRQIFDMVLESGISCQTIANNMLQYSRQAKPSHRTEEDVNRLLQRTLEVLGKHLGVEKVALELDLDPREPRARVEPSKLQQGLVNLIVNAVHALLELEVDYDQRQLAIRTRRDDVAGQVHIEIADRGPGIHPKRLAKIFQPFFTTKDHGTGLGLYITQRVIEDLGGTIKVTSKVGEGTTFTISLPQA